MLIKFEAIKARQGKVLCHIPWLSFILGICNTVSAHKLQFASSSSLKSLAGTTRAHECCKLYVIMYMIIYIVVQSVHAWCLATRFSSSVKGIVIRLQMQYGYVVL